IYKMMPQSRDAINASSVVDKFMSTISPFYTLIIIVALALSVYTDTATTEIYTLSLHDALPISEGEGDQWVVVEYPAQAVHDELLDRKSTRLNSSHVKISYAVFCLKKKKG